VRADPLPAPLGQDANAREFAVVSRVRLVNADAAEPRPLVRFLVDGDDLIAGPKGGVVQAHLLDMIEQPDLVAVLGIPDVHAPR